jgi:hypothetical protein
MVKYIPSFMFCYKFYLVINKIKVKFVINESKYVCEYCKIIWNLNRKCNSYIPNSFQNNP